MCVIYVDSIEVLRIDQLKYYLCEVFYRDQLLLVSFNCVYYCTSIHLILMPGKRILPVCQNFLV